MVVYEPAGDQVKVTTDGTTGDGKRVHTEWTGKFDGKNYAASLGCVHRQSCVQEGQRHTLLLTNKKDGKVTASGRIVVSADGKSRTVTVNATNSEGKKVSSTAVYDKQ
jgi:hypothetical protein